MMRNIWILRDWLELNPMWFNDSIFQCFVVTKYMTFILLFRCHQEVDFDMGQIEDRYCAQDGMICVLHAGTFLLDAGIKLVSSFHSSVTNQSALVLSQTFSPSGYLSFHHYLLLDLSPSGYLLLTVDAVLSDSKSMSWTSWLDVDSYQRQTDALKADRADREDRADGNVRVVRSVGSGQSG
jgi:hypothetical protein